MLLVNQFVKGSVAACSGGARERRVLLSGAVFLAASVAFGADKAAGTGARTGTADSAETERVVLPDFDSANPEPDGPGFSQWERVVRGFRREHHFAVTGGYEVGNWLVGSLGKLRSLQTRDSGFWGRAEYTHHLQIYRGLGYFLGSSAGATYTRTDDSAPVKPPTSLIYPGVVAGAVYNFSPSIRALGAASINLERYDGLRGINPDEDGVEVPPTEISITVESYDAMIGVDFFPALQFAVRLEFHDRYQFYRKPRDAGDKPVNADLERFDRWLGAGIVYHLL